MQVGVPFRRGIWTLTKALAIIFLPFALAGCNSISQQAPDPVASSRNVATARAERGVAAFAQAACGGCHAVKAGMLSANPASLGFAEIANKAGLTQASLAT